MLSTLIDLDMGESVNKCVLGAHNAPSITANTPESNGYGGEDVIEF